jgi:hypothetical protein
MMPHVDDHGDWDREEVAQTEGGWCLSRAHLCPASTTFEPDEVESETAKLRFETNLTPVTQKRTQGQQKKQSGKRKRAPIDFFDSQQQALSWKNTRLP